MLKLSKALLCCLMCASLFGTGCGLEFGFPQWSQVGDEKNPCSWIVASIDNRNNIGHPRVSDLIVRNNHGSRKIEVSVSWVVQRHQENGSYDTATKHHTRVLNPGEKAYVDSIYIHAFDGVCCVNVNCSSTRYVD
jgi:hypothetical protein